MSRIEEAWRRASGRSGGDPALSEPPVASASTTVADEGELVLGRYRVEPRGPAPAAPRPRVSEAIARPAPRLDPPRLEIAVALRGKLVVTPESEPLAIEQYRRLGAVLEDLGAQRALKSVMVSSALPREGKTLTVTNLALTLSESYRRRVLLIDADFHRPSVHRMFGIANDAGLADALGSPDGRAAVVHLSSTLSVLPTGQLDGQPIAALSSERLGRLVADAASQFDWVLLDTPPVGMLSDAHLVARATDGVLLVIAAGITPYTLVQRSLDEIGRDRVVGTVLNRVEKHAIPVGDYYRDYADRP